MKRRVLFAPVVIGQLLFLSLQPTQGATTSFGPVPFNFVGFGPAVVSVPQFNPGQGTLTEIKLELEVAADTQFGAWDSESGAFEEESVEIHNAVRVKTESTVEMFFTELFQLDGIVFGPDDDDAPDFAGADSFSGGGSPCLLPLATSGCGATESFLPDPAFIGIGDIDVSIENNVTAMISNPLIESTIIDPGETFGSLKVTYTFIPEPASSALLLLAALLTSCCYRRKN